MCCSCSLKTTAPRPCRLPLPAGRSYAPCHMGLRHGSMATTEIGGDNEKRGTVRGGGVGGSDGGPSSPPFRVGLRRFPAHHRHRSALASAARRPLLTHRSPPAAPWSPTDARGRTPPPPFPYAQVGTTKKYVKDMMAATMETKVPISRPSSCARTTCRGQTSPVTSSHLGCSLHRGPSNGASCWAPRT